MGKSRNVELDLPNEFFSRRSELTDCLAACVLWEPLRCPSREALPRELVSDRNLRVVLANAIVCRTAEKMAVALASELGMPYTVELLSKLGIYVPGYRRHYSWQLAFIWHLDWYAERLRRVEQLYREHLAALGRIAELQAASSEWRF